MFLWPKCILKRDFALAGKIIHDHKCSCYATFFLLEHDDLISGKYFVTFHEDLE